MLIKSKKDTFNLDLCKTPFKQFLGLMFRFPKNDGLLFEFKKEEPVSLHMLFVFIKIDIVYLDKDKKTIKILKRVKPFTPYIKATKCKYILELKDSKNLYIGEKLNF
ncbi:DUF192 domain-containing protein [Candidatus Woesearchaeota archaeon]|nr:DUF192 domain-containing protein [Candidatus Woesearchaeota archaeon]